MSRELRADSETLPSPRPANCDRTAMRPPPPREAPACKADLSSANMEEVLLYALVGHHPPSAMGVLEGACDALRTYAEALAYGDENDPQAKALFPIVRRLEAGIELLQRARG